MFCLKSILLVLFASLPFALSQKCMDNPRFVWTATQSGRLLTLQCKDLFNAYRIRRYCSRAAIKNQCLKTCDNCPPCVDDSSFFWTYRYNGQTHTLTCSFLNGANSEQKNQQRRDNWCPSVVDGVSISDKCAKTCGQCQNNDPTRRPTRAPTPVPTRAPACVDNSRFSWIYRFNGQTYNLNCQFLNNANNPQQNEKRRNNWCPQIVDGVSIAKKCRKTCGQCQNDPTRHPTPSPRPSCSDNYRFTFTDINSVTRSCNWLDNIQRTNFYCNKTYNGYRISSKCRKSCGVCNSQTAAV